MKLRNPTLIRLVAFAAALVIRCWMSTLRVRIVSQDGKVHPTNWRRERYIYAFWHETLLAPTVRKARVRIMISLHADGELIAQIVRFLGYGVVRGSPKRGGIMALMDMMSASDRSHLIVTPDGPRGPRRRLKLGIVYLASRTGLPIVPLGIGFTRAWRARSWDRFAMPWPFSTVLGIVGEPLAVPPGLDREDLERERVRIEEKFLAVTAAAERWAAVRAGRAVEESPTEERRASA